MIHLQALDLAIAALLVLALAAITRWQRLAVSGSLLVAAARTVVQLMLVGLVLKTVFGDVHPAWLALMALFMLAVAAYEVGARQRYRLRGRQYLVGAGSLALSAFAVTLLALTVVIGVEPWYTPQYAIPLLGMMLGNSMNTVALALNRLHEGLKQQQGMVEAQLALGFTWRQASRPLRHEALRVGLIPTINAMAAAGVVSLPGMMTGQILAGTPPMEAVKYQILIMFLITATGGFACLLAVRFSCGRLFDERHRLRLDRLNGKAD